MASKMTQFAGGRYVHRTDIILTSSNPRFAMRQLIISAWSVEKSIQFNAFESDWWKIIAGQLPSGDPNAMRKTNHRRHLIEHYVHVRDTIVTDIQHARAVYDVPFIAINVDLITNAVQNQKYVAIRLSLNLKGHMKSYNIAVRKFDLTSNDILSYQASENLMNWTVAILGEFRIGLEADVATSTGDGGPDVRRAFSKLFSTGLHEWCLSHLGNKAMEEGFGASVDPAKSKNRAARAVIMKVRTLIESLNKSGLLKRLYEDAVVEEFGRYLKLRNSPTHRWASIEDVLANILKKWDAIEKAYSLADGKEFPLTTDDYKVGSNLNVDMMAVLLFMVVLLFR